MQSSYCVYIQQYSHTADRSQHGTAFTTTSPTKGLVEGFWPVSDEGAATFLHTVGKRETETRDEQLLDVWAADIFSLLDLNNPEDLTTSTQLSVSGLQWKEVCQTNVDRAEAGTMPGSHILVEALDSIGTRELTEFLVHVVCAGSRVVTEPDAKVLNFQWLLLVDLHHKRAKHNTECRRMRRQSCPPAT
jgi:hypothetical protein